MSSTGKAMGLKSLMGQNRPKSTGSTMMLDPLSLMSTLAWFIQVMLTELWAMAAFQSIRTGVTFSRA